MCKRVRVEREEEEVPSSLPPYHLLTPAQVRGRERASERSFAAANSQAEEKAPSGSSPLPLESNRGEEGEAEATEGGGGIEGSVVVL